MTHTDLKEAAMKATPGPWFNDGGIIWYDSREQVCCGRSGLECCGQPDIKGGPEQLGEASEKNATFIALANPSSILSLIEDNERLREALNDAIDCVEAWGGYASDYFKDKHDFQGDLDRLRAALKEKPHD